MIHVEVNSERYLEEKNKDMPHILDSGERRQFETGAVRDIQEGKGRCDLMPLEVLKLFFEDPIFTFIERFKCDRDTLHLRHALESFMCRAFDGPYTMFLEVAKHFEEGAKKYGENNWQKGLPVKCYIDSAVRHYLKWLRGDKDEPHDRAFVWNLMCCIWEVDFSPFALGETAVADTIYKDNTPVIESLDDGTVRSVNSDRFYICNRKPCDTCRSDCHCTHVLNDAAVLEVSDSFVPYNDCPTGLFLHADGVFLKTEIEDSKTHSKMAVHIGLGLARKFDEDTVMMRLWRSSLSGMNSTRTMLLGFPRIS